MTGQEGQGPRCQWGEGPVRIPTPTWCRSRGTELPGGCSSNQHSLPGLPGASTRSLFRGSFPGGSWIRSGATPFRKAGCTGVRSPLPGAPGRLVRNSPLPPRAQHPGPSRLRSFSPQQPGGERSVTHAPRACSWDRRWVHVLALSQAGLARVCESPNWGSSTSSGWAGRSPILNPRVAQRAKPNCNCPLFTRTCVPHAPNFTPDLPGKSQVPGRVHLQGLLSRPGWLQSSGWAPCLWQDSAT